MSNFKSLAKRKRELAKLDKRQAKEQRRAARRTDQGASAADAPAVTVVAVAQPMLGKKPGADLGAAVEKKPLTLADAVERWRNTRPAKPKKR